MIHAIDIYIYIYIHFQMVRQKLCQKSVSGRGSLEESSDCVFFFVCVCVSVCVCHVSEHIIIRFQFGLVTFGGAHHPISNMLPIPDL